MAELVARVRAQLRVVAQASASTLRAEGIEVDLLTRRVRRGGQAVHAVDDRVRAARVPPAPPRPGGLARADPQRGVGLRARSRDERRRRVRRLPAPQARPARTSPRRSSPCAPSATGSAARAERDARAARRLVPVGLRWRLAGWVALVTLLCIGDRLRRRLPRHRDPAAPPDRPARSPATRPSSPHNLMARGRRARRGSSSRAAARYIRDQPFSASSTLLFVLDPGRAHRAPTGRSCSATRRPTTARRAPNRRRRTASPRTAADARRRLHARSTLPDVGDLRVLKRRGARRPAA